LGSNYSGLSSISYVPEDIIEFRLKFFLRPSPKTASILLVSSYISLSPLIFYLV